MEAGIDHEESGLLEAAFIDGFRTASDRRGFLRLAAVPDELPHGLKLVEVRIEDGYTVGSAAPGFASAELVYQPLPNGMIRGSSRLVFVYVSISQRRELSLADVVALRDGGESGADAAASQGADHRHPHHH